MGIIIEQIEKRKKVNRCSGKYKIEKNKDYFYQDLRSSQNNILKKAKELEAKKVDETKKASSFQQKIDSRKGKERILVVNDERAVLMVLVTRLQLAGYQVFSATNGEEALESFHTDSPDLIVLDFMLPKMDAFTLCRRIRAESLVPIICLTPLEDISNRVAGLGLGAVDYLSKPFSPKELEARIATILRGIARAEGRENKQLDKDKKNLSLLERKTRSQQIEFLNFALAVAQTKGDEEKSKIYRQKILELGGNVDELDASDRLIFNQWQRKSKEAKAKKDKEYKLMKEWASKITILLIEDDRDMRDLVVRHLEHSGFDVQKAEDGIKGQALALLYSPDLILLDLMLPSVDGLTLCQRLRRDERTSNIPILMITALGFKKDTLKNKITGFNPEIDGIIKKPFDLDEINVRIKKLVENKKKS